MRQYEMCEITIPGATPSSDWAAAAPEAVFTCGEAVHRVKGFVSGEGVYKVRFLPEISGAWNYTVTGCVSAEGALEVAPAGEDSHGIVQAVDCHFEHRDGTFFYPFGTTVYALIHQSEELYEQTMQTLAQAPFNKIRFCVFPKHYDFNHNEPRHYAFRKQGDRWNVGEPDFEYWNMLEDAVFRLQKLGIQCDLILFHPYDRWGFSALTQEEDGLYLDYLLRRLSAVPNLWWSMANEYDLFPHKDRARWEFIENYLARNDPYHHLIGNHNCFAFWDHSRENITHVSVQTKAISRIPQWRAKYAKPVCIDECCYEGNIIHSWGSISGREMTYRFWRAVANGGYCTHGETFYDDEEVLWWARGGRLHGESPERIAFLRKIVEGLPGPIEPTVSGLGKLFAITPEQLEQMKAQTPPEFLTFVNSILSMDEGERNMFLDAEPAYAGHVGEEAYLIFLNLCTCAKSEIELPEDKQYTLKLIDTWNMTVDVIAEHVSGKTAFALPGKEGFAVLATLEK